MRGSRRITVWHASVPSEMRGDPARGNGVMRGRALVSLVPSPDLMSRLPDSYGRYGTQAITCCRCAIRVSLGVGRRLHDKIRPTDREGLEANDAAQLRVRTIPSGHRRRSVPGGVGWSSHAAPSVLDTGRDP